MAHGIHNVFLATMASAGTLTSEINLGRSWHRMKIESPARSNTTLYVQAANASGGTFRRIYAEGNATTSPALFQVASNATNVMIPIPAGYQFIKIESQDAISDGAGFKIIASDM